LTSRAPRSAGSNATLTGASWQINGASDPADEEKFQAPFEHGDEHQWERDGRARPARKHDHTAPPDQRKRRLLRIASRLTTATAEIR
jgi:hypothetical protein